MEGLVIVEENMSNLTSASGEASASSNQQSSLISREPSPVKKKRNLPGNPVALWVLILDPDAEVIAMSPKTLMATNRFVCEICNKGFQRDQNLQLHRRGHNLPWKLKQRSKEARKKVYVCPEVTCVHHEPSRALGDLTGIKKHFSRKHGEKKWKCDKCSKKYAVQSDWKAHYKICGTREYRCDCGTLFSRRDSFVTHRAFCDALTERSSRVGITANPIADRHLLQCSHPTAPLEPFPLQQPVLQSQFTRLMRATEVRYSPLSSHGLQQELALKREQQQHFDRSDIPPWLNCEAITSLNYFDVMPSSIYPMRLDEAYPHENPVPPPPFFPTYHSATSFPNMSATALLQQAAQMGSTVSRPSDTDQMATHTVHDPSTYNATSGFDLGLSSSHQEVSGGRGGGSGQVFAPPALLQDMMLNPLSSTPGFAGSFDDALGRIPGFKRRQNSFADGVVRSQGRDEGGGVGGNDGMTIDFLGPRAVFPQGYP
ncbi:hypothetical protein BHE74_00000693 [Ensete ventricosum]|nr:hypothetical protein BHE74_00000693 [Ensete ventricosum]